MTERRCGDCSLCCKLVPVAEIGKAANQRCEQQRTGKGCLVYHKSIFPRSCKVWSCVWLLNEAAEFLPRPDHAHYVIDSMPDYITVQAEDGTTGRLPVVQIWVDPQHRNAHRNPRLRAWIARRAETHGQAALIRYSSTDAIVLLPPFVTGEGWIEKTPQSDGKGDHTQADIAETYRQFRSKGNKDEHSQS